MPFVLDDVALIEPYGLAHEKKSELYKEALSDLTWHHYKNCTEYARILDAMGYDPQKVQPPENQPMIPVRLFKEYELLSSQHSDIVKTMTSSGTSGQAVSKIFLDKTNVKNQTKVLTEIITSYIGKKRLPLLILDTEQVKKDRAMFSARGAGIIGFSIFGKETLYALDADMNINIDAIKEFIEKHQGESILMFGYTYMIWQYVVQALISAGVKFHVDDAVLFHIGGWKKLKDQAVDTETYNRTICDVFGNVKVHNYYGMAEQLGSVFVECKYGHMHCSNYSDVIIRRPGDFSVAEKGERGLIELLSLLPTSYPGHILLTEDEGEILGEDDCPCGRQGKYFKIYGRIKGAELRGCSDTYERH
ncbi:MAG: acyl-protein synthetase [Candidatus Fimivivens sp.]|nr:acyl-protein synthetase [Candidatus Fimivivens sp.]